MSDVRTRGERNHLIAQIRELRERADNAIALVRIGSEGQLRAQIEDVRQLAESISQMVASTDESRPRVARTRGGRP